MGQKWNQFIALVELFFHHPSPELHFRCEEQSGLKV
jgi:hypothetical protein